MTLELFSCVPLSSRLTHAACGKRHLAVKASATGRTPSGAISLQSSACLDCPIGAAHARGDRPTTWPDGTAIEAADVVAHTSAPPKPKPKPNVLGPRRTMPAPATRPPSPETIAARAAGHKKSAAANRSRAKTFTHAGLELTIAQWIARPEVIALGLKENTVRARLELPHWDFARAITTPAREMRTLAPRKVRSASSARIAHEGDRIVVVGMGLRGSQVRALKACALLLNRSVSDLVREAVDGWIRTAAPIDKLAAAVSNAALSERA